jgi:hypothetical protein
MIESSGLIEYCHLTREFIDDDAIPGCAAAATKGATPRRATPGRQLTEDRRMSLAVIGAGLGRNATLSLKVALDRLGFGPCYHMSEVFRHPDHIAIWRAATRGEAVDWEALLSGYHSIVDWPGCTFWRELRTANPDAFVLLSHRDPAAWHKSVLNTIYHPMTMDPPPNAPRFFAHFQAMARELILDSTFDGRLPEFDHAAKVYRAHNDAVRGEVPADRLIDYEVGSGWEPLCNALGVPIPDEPFPRTNTTDEFRSQMGMQRP